MLNLGIVAALLVTLLVFISGCVPEGTSGQEASNPLYMIVFLVFIFGVFYLLMIRPQRKRQKEHETLVQELKKGDQVVTAGGIYGQIESLSQDSIVLKIESGATIRIARGSVSGRRQK